MQLDNDLSPDPDDYLGEGRLSLAALIEEATAEGSERTVELTACTHALKLAEWAAASRMPDNLDAAQGSVTVHVAAKTVGQLVIVTVRMVKATNLLVDAVEFGTDDAPAMPGFSPTGSVKLSRFSTVDSASGSAPPTPQGADAHADEWPGGHGQSKTAFVLQNIKRWIDQAISSGAETGAVRASYNMDYHPTNWP